MTRKSIDFEGLAQALLGRAEELLKQWLPGGRKQGREFVCGDLSGAEGASLSINVRTGVWTDFNTAGGRVGGKDLTSLYAAIHGISNIEAARELMGVVGMSEQAPPGRPARPAGRDKAAAAGEPAPAKRAEATWMALHPVPDDAPPYRAHWAHYSRGVPKAHWEYRDREGRLLGVVCRFDKSDGGKDIQPLSFCVCSDGRRAWRYKAFNEPRPLYGMDRLPQVQPGDERPLVLVVEGEKCADALWEHLKRKTPVVTWPNGCKAVGKADWAALAGCRAVGWADADAKVDKATGQRLPREEQPGFAAMRTVQARLEKLDVPMRLVDIGQPGDRPDGWDCADAIADGWTREQALTFMRNLAPDVVVSAGGDGASTPTNAARAEEGDEPSWRDRLIWRNAWQLRECVPNVVEMMLHHPQWRGVLAFDEFSQRIVKRKPAPYEQASAVRPSTEWTDVDDTRAAMWLAQREKFVPSASMVAEAVAVVAREQCFHPVREYLQGLSWDDQPRLDMWIVDLMGVEDSPYVRLVSRWFLIGMVMRVLEPGVKFDYCLVLEGDQGRYKSSALRILAGEWFSDIELDLTNKDAMSNIRGKWLHEFGEMGSLMRAESQRQKSFLSRQFDEFRPVYGRREISCPRQTAFSGTTNIWHWNKDPTGGRRFWPVFVPDEVNLPALRAVRDQLFAEAYQAALAGDRYWPTADEQRELFDPEQLAREEPDAFVDLLNVWFNDRNVMVEEFTLAEAIVSGLKIEPRGITRDIQTRVGQALAKLGCEKVERRSKHPRFVYKRPPRNAASSEPVSEYDTEGQGVPI